MKKYILIFILTLAAFAVHLHYVFSKTDGVEVYAMALGVLDPYETYKYHKSIKMIISNNDPEALRILINSDCGGGAGCYEHGKTLLLILIKVGDEKFSQMATRLDESEKGILFNLLCAGHEYGGLYKNPTFEKLRTEFPLTINLLFPRYNTTLKPTHLRGTYFVHNRTKQVPLQWSV